MKCESILAERDSRDGAALDAPAKVALRYPADVWLILASLAYVTAILLLPRAWLIALGIWWVSNTVSHNFIHQPFFRSRALNRSFAFYLTAITGIPQRLWRDRHLAHHADVRWKLCLSRELLQQTLLVAILWAIVFAVSARFAALVLLPGFAGALVLCWLQGHYEHARGTQSHYGRLYNALFFNDGFHLEHHHAPKVHWTELRRAGQAGNRWPAVLRWFDFFSLDELERFAMRSRSVRAWLVRIHERALRAVWRDLAAPKQVAIVGGGLFPRSALVVRKLWPGAEITIYDSSVLHLKECERWLLGDELLIHARLDGPQDVAADLIIVPLALRGRKEAFYRSGRRVLIHDWLWRTFGGRSMIVSFLLGKRMNLVNP